METPSEWAKRFSRPKTGEEAALPDPEAATVDRQALTAEFLSEPFSCPACGQLLGPSCRVCVACGHPINPAEVAQRAEVVLPAVYAPSTEPRPEPVRYPWGILFIVLGVVFLLGLLYSSAISVGLLKEDKTQLALRAAPLLAGVWVFFDALRRRVPRPLRWAVGTILLLIVVFPWYLARRKTPQSPVPFVEAEVGPVTRVLLFVLLFLFLASLIYTLVQGPPPTRPSTPQPQIQRPGDSSPSRITTLRPGKAGERRHRPGAESRSRLGAPCAQAETSAPSDAWQT
jgi:hypothetical protein